MVAPDSWRPSTKRAPTTAPSTSGLGGVEGVGILVGGEALALLSRRADRGSE
jgi:hypothetical protein